MDAQTQSLIQWVLVFLFGGGGIYGLWTAARSNKKTAAETEEIYTRIALSLLKPQEERITELERKLAECQEAMEKRVKSVEKKMAKVKG